MSDQLDNVSADDWEPHGHRYRRSTTLVEVVRELVRSEIEHPVLRSAESQVEWMQSQ
ncbi:MAG: hypothetical protein R2706_13115 [Acidimicrobiales bacterium]